MDVSAPPTWTPPAGKEHRFCPQCRKWFAGVPEAERCPECTVGRNSKRRTDNVKRRPFLPCEECGKPRFEIGILVCRECWNNLHERGPAFGASVDR